MRNPRLVFALTLTLLAALLPLGLGACRASGSGAAKSPAGTWTLVALEGTELTALARAPELVIGADGALSGFTGVNRFSGRAEPGALNAGWFMAGPLAATRMAGEPQAMEVEGRFLALLATRLEWRLTGTPDERELALLERRAVKARFRAAGG